MGSAVRREGGKIQGKDYKVKVSKEEGHSPQGRSYLEIGSIRRRLPKSLLVTCQAARGFISTIWTNNNDKAYLRIQGKEAEALGMEKGTDYYIIAVPVDHPLLSREFADAYRSGYPPTLA